MAVLLLPVVLLNKEWDPEAVLLPPLVFLLRVFAPIDELSFPVVVLKALPEPIAIFLEDEESRNLAPLEKLARVLLLMVEIESLLAVMVN